MEEASSLGRQTNPFFLQPKQKVNFSFWFRKELMESKCIITVSYHREGKLNSWKWAGMNFIWLSGESSAGPFNSLLFIPAHSLRMDELMKRRKSWRPFSAPRRNQFLSFHQLSSIIDWGMKWNDWRQERSALLVGCVVWWVVGYGRLAAMALREEKPTQQQPTHSLSIFFLQFSCSTNQLYWLMSWMKERREESGWLNGKRLRVMSRRLLCRERIPFQSSKLLFHFISLAQSTNQRQRSQWKRRAAAIQKLNGM